MRILLTVLSAWLKTRSVQSPHQPKPHRNPNVNPSPSRSIRCCRGSCASTYPPSLTSPLRSRKKKHPTLFDYPNDENNPNRINGAFVSSGGSRRQEVRISSAADASVEHGWRSGNVGAAKGGGRLAVSDSIRPRLGIRGGQKKLGVKWRNADTARESCVSRVSEGLHMCCTMFGPHFDMCWLLLLQAVSLICQAYTVFSRVEYMVLLQLVQERCCSSLVLFDTPTDIRVSDIGVYFRAGDLYWIEQNNALFLLTMWIYHRLIPLAIGHLQA